MVFTDTINRLTKEQIIEQAQQYYPEFEAKGFSTEDYNQFVAEAADHGGAVR